MSEQQQPVADRWAADRVGGVRRLLADRGVKAKILAAVGVVGLVSVIVAGTAVVSSNRLKAATEELATLQHTLVTDRGTVHQDQLKARMLIAQVAAVHGDEAKATWADKIADNDAELDAAVRRIDAAGGQKVMPTWDAFKTHFGQWRMLRDGDLLFAARMGDNATYTQLMESKSQPMIDVFVDDLDQATEALNTYAKQQAEHADPAAAALEGQLA
jgi:methyl-accepting chemotaxis protein